MPLDIQGPEFEALMQRLAQEPPAVTAPAPEKKGIGVAPWLAMLLGQGADLATTAYGLNNGYEEANPIMGSSKGRVLGTKAGVMGGMALLMKMLESRNPTAGKGVGYVSGAMGAIPAALNIRTMTKDK